ncbi:hypothetical protein WA026_001997 [Henosepilachna vigintioctopunctata]|uniref:MADF domain-containing protein n=1 Tax=Henosepilachna vigintioctopunctata TaxID=420089 RepID=A0AAW1UTE4_9CUCU
MDIARCLELIELYKERSFLWNPKDTMYHNKKKREDAWGEISQLMKIPVPELKAKMKTLMGTYRSERSKEKKSKIKGSGSRDKYSSKWFAFKSFEFLMNRDQPRGTVDTDMNQASEEGILTPEIVTEETQPTTTQTTTTSQRAALKRKRELLSDDKMMKEAFQLLKSSAAISQDPCHAYGMYIANELKNFDRKTQAYIKKGIADVFFKAEMGLFLPATRPVLVSPSPQDNSPSGSRTSWPWDEELEYKRE